MHLTRGALRDYLAHRTVLVTGAGGTIGTELSRQLCELRPAHLVLVDVSEHNLFELEHRLAPPGGVTFRLANVQQAGAMDAIFSTHRPDVVLHAAAYKHVPLMERHPIAAFRNNTLTTTQLLQQSTSYGVEQFVLVSTDKAVAPISVLGATKQLAEWAVRHAAPHLSAKIVRFGNVFGSRGSVVPLFLQQLAEGGPVKITHPDMERYFMTAQEAGSLILQTLLLDTMPVYALKMGSPIRIQWLAEALVRRLAPEHDPSDLIVFTGRRPGEKLREQLQSSEETARPTTHPRVLGLEGPVPVDKQSFRAHLDRLCAFAQDQAAAALRTTLVEAESVTPLDAA